MNPPLRTEDDRQALIEGAALTATIDCIATDHAPHAARREGGPVRAGGDGGDRARDRLRRRSTPSSCCPACSTSALLVERMSGGAAPFGLEPPRIAAGQPRRTSPSSTSTPSGRWARTAGRAAPRTPASPGGGCAARVADDGRRRARSPTAQRSFAMGVGRVSAPKLDPRAGRAGRDRRPGGASARRSRASTDVAAATGDPGPRAPRRSGSRSSSPSSTRRGSGATVPEVAEHLPDGRRARSTKVRFSAASRPTASTSAGATRRSSAGSRPTSASTRPCSTCSTRASRSTSPPTRSARARDANRDARPGARWSAPGAVLTSVETALFELLGGAGTDRASKQVQELVNASDAP